MFVIKPPAASVPRAPRALAARTVRKIALFGSHSTSLADAPWDDPSWERWGHAASMDWYARPMDVLFDLHVPACRMPPKPGRYMERLRRLTTPIYMQRRYQDIPHSLEYPKGRILTEFSYAHRRQYFSNQVAWMIALAITEGVTHIGLFGIDYSARSEYATQRGSAEYWLGQLDGRGVTVVLPSQCSLLAEPGLLYGYESHDAQTGKLVDAYKAKEWKTPAIKPIRPGERVALAQPPEDVRLEMEAEERTHPHPPWSLKYRDGQSQVETWAEGPLPQADGSPSEGFTARFSSVVTVTGPTPPPEPEPHGGNGQAKEATV